MSFEPFDNMSVSKYIETLNLDPEVALQEIPDATLQQDELALFTNADFFNLDVDANGEIDLFNFSGGEKKPVVGSVAAPTAPTASVTPAAPLPALSAPQMSTTLSTSAVAVPNVPSVPNVATPVETQMQFTPTPIPIAPTAGTKRKAADTPSNIADIVEEDKRRRNTAASARFRIKKKLREQEMERTARELTEKVSALETKIMKLEMENKWLRTLIIEKNEQKDDEILQGIRNRILEAKSESRVSKD